MALRGFLFSSDEGTANLIRQVFTGLGVEEESCAEADETLARIAQDSFQFLVVDWDQPEASRLLGAARERKASERPIALAIVSEDGSVSKALQAGANSILRRPLLLNQVKDTLTTARDLLRARLDAAAKAATAAAGGSLPAKLESPQPGSEKGLRAGEFLNAQAVASSGQVETDSEIGSAEFAPASDPEPLQDLEPVAAPPPAAPPEPAPERPRSLEELLRSRGVARQASPAQTPAPGESGKPELQGFDQIPSQPRVQNYVSQADEPSHEQKQEDHLFAYMAGESGETKPSAPSRFRLGKGAIIAASILAAAATVLAPQAPWHPRIQALAAREQRALHAWLNPQLVTTPQAPATHEDFGRAGDEYKLPAAEAIPDATTDPSQIRVVPVIDPTAKKPAGEAPGQDPASDPTPVPTATAGPPSDPAQAPGSQVPPSQAIEAASGATQATGSTASAPATLPVTAPVPGNAAKNSNPPAVAYTPVTATAAPSKPQSAPYVPPTTKVPSSLRSQMTSMVPDESGSKSPEAALQAIEPVAVPELTERALLTEQPVPDIPASAGGQQGTVILEVLIGRDGGVEDAKFLQGSLAFARSAIDGVKRWKFKPYTMNGRAVSVSTRMTIKFPPQ
jgi:TonB family protein